MSALIRLLIYDQTFLLSGQPNRLNTMVMLPNALRQILIQPVSQRTVLHISEQAIQVVIQVPFPFLSSAPQQSQVPVPSLIHFVASVIKSSHVRMRTLMASLVYLRRLRSVLPPAVRGLPCSAHKIFLTCLILATKYINDICPKNKHWVTYSAVPCYLGSQSRIFGFTISDINAMETELLRLLEWDLRIDLDDLYEELRSLLSSNDQKRSTIDNRPTLCLQVPRIPALAVDRYQLIGRRPQMCHRKLGATASMIPFCTPQLNEKGSACGLVVSCEDYTESQRVYV
jgi:hypothetical protein